MSAFNNDNSSDERNRHLAHHHHSTRMTPSIITTINNADPSCLVNTTNNNNGANLTSKSKKTVEPYYESYIEDSFVGHWEREDDDPNDEYKANVEGSTSNEPGDDEQELHPSTIEFDFDSFGPESFIYTPAATNQSTVDKDSTITQDQPKSGEVKKLEQETGKKEDRSTAASNSPPKQPVLNSNSIDYLVDTARIDLKVIEPYKKVISHAGYCHHFDPSAPAPKPGEPAPAIIVFSACYLPDRSRRDYNYVMDHLFLYVLSSLHELIADDYILIYLHNTQPSLLTSNTFLKSSLSSNIGNGSSSSTSSEELQNQNNLPTFTWMKRCYQMIDRRLRKNLKILYLVKPTFWLKTIVIMCKPFISAKFSKKLRFVEDMNGLKKCLPVDKLILPASADNL